MTKPLALAGAAIALLLSLSSRATAAVIPVDELEAVRASASVPVANMAAPYLPPSESAPAGVFSKPSFVIKHPSGPTSESSSGRPPAPTGRPDSPPRPTGKKPEHPGKPAPVPTVTANVLSLCDGKEQVMPTKPAHKDAAGPVTGRPAGHGSGKKPEKASAGPAGHDSKPSAHPTGKSAAHPSKPSEKRPPGQPTVHATGKSPEAAPAHPYGGIPTIHSIPSNSSRPTGIPPSSPPKPPHVARTEHHGGAPADEEVIGAIKLLVRGLVVEVPFGADFKDFLHDDMVFSSEEKKKPEEPKEKPKKPKEESQKPKEEPNLPKEELKKPEAELEKPKEEPARPLTSTAPTPSMTLKGGLQKFETSTRPESASKPSPSRDPIRDRYGHHPSAANPSPSSPIPVPPHSPPKPRSNPTTNSILGLLRGDKGPLEKPYAAVKRAEELPSHEEATRDCRDELHDQCGWDLLCAVGKWFSPHCLHDAEGRVVDKEGKVIGTAIEEGRKKVKRGDMTQEEKGASGALTGVVQQAGVGEMGQQEKGASGEVVVRVQEVSVVRDLLEGKELDFGIDGSVKVMEDDGTNVLGAVEHDKDSVVEIDEDGKMTMDDGKLNVLEVIPHEQESVVEVGEDGSMTMDDGKLNVLEVIPHEKRDQSKPKAFGVLINAEVPENAAVEFRKGVITPTEDGDYVASVIMDVDLPDPNVKVGEDGKMTMENGELNVLEVLD